LPYVGDDGVVSTRNALAAAPMDAAGSAGSDAGSSGASKRKKTAAWVPKPSSGAAAAASM